MAHFIGSFSSVKIQPMRILLDMLYPRICRGCGQAVEYDRSHLCWECLTSIVWIKAPLCWCCGVPVEGRVDHTFTCFACSQSKWYFKRARAAAFYDQILRNLLCDFKYHQAIWLKEDLGTLLQAGLSCHFDPNEFDVICPVPLFHVKKRLRGYNQAKNIGKNASCKI